MEHLPAYISIVFGVTTILTILLFYKASGNSATTLMVLLSWLVLQTFLGLSGFYTVTDEIPPRFMFLVLIPSLFIICLFIFPKGRQYLEKLDLKTLTLLHTVRIPVELVLFWLFIQGVVPQLMTFEGRNFDILSGLTAPLVYYFGFIKKQTGRISMLTWNLICLGLLLNIVIHAALSVPTPLQKLAFDQPNIAILYFPFLWLPCCVVPLVLLSHLTAIKHYIQHGQRIYQNPT